MDSLTFGKVEEHDTWWNDNRQETAKI